MCGRYNLITDTAALVEFFEIESGLVSLGETPPRYNIAPSQWVPAARQSVNGRELVQLKWGLIPFWAKDAKIAYHTINARAETVAVKPAYREAFKRRRCLIPATGFYEWKQQAGRKQPYHIGLRDAGLFAFAGLWESWSDEDGKTIESCSIIVTAAEGSIRTLHDRMPVIMGRGTFAAWLDPHNTDQASLQSLLVPRDLPKLQFYPVSQAVNNPRNDSEVCIQALAEPAAE